MFGFFKKFMQAYKASQIWTSIENSEDLKKAYQESHQKPIIIFTHSTMHFRSDYIMGNLESQARRMDLSRVKFFNLNYTGNSKLKEEISQDLGFEVEKATFLLFRDGQLIFKRHEELINMERLLSKLFEE
ncbi:MAG: DUF2847 family protein [Flavobacteriaceae bacterium]|nr:DUF2847 family protein [Flavobacteriaceae bacterium]